MKRAIPLCLACLLIFVLPVHSIADNPWWYVFYEETQYDMFSSPATENNRDGEHIQIHGIVGYSNSSNGCLYIIVEQEDGREWLALLYDVNIPDIKDKPISLYGVYAGTNEMFYDLPTLFALRYQFDTVTFKVLNGTRALSEDYEEGGTKNARTLLEKHKALLNTDKYNIQSEPAISPKTSATAKPYNPPTVSLAEFNALRNGISYEKACEVIGSRGTLISEVSLGGVNTKMYQWDGEGKTGANANATFQNDKMVSKAQYGLE